MSLILLIVAEQTKTTGDREHILHIGKQEKLIFGYQIMVIITSTPNISILLSFCEY